MAQVKVVITNGTIEISVDGTEDAASAMQISAALVERFKVAGIPITRDSGPEQHKPDHAHAHVVSRHGHGH
jgi:hypothetical protein